MATGFWPDTISTDGFSTSRSAPSVRDYPNVMSKFLNFGMNIKSVVAASTLTPSRVFPFLRDKGTLNVGAPADIAVLDLQEGNFQFVDNYENVRNGTYRFSLLKLSWEDRGLHEYKQIHTSFDLRILNNNFHIL